MSKIIRSRDEVFKAVSKYYKYNRISKWNFVRRLKAINAILEGEETISENTNWIYITENIEFFSTATKDEVKGAKKAIREELVGILTLLDVKASRNKVMDLRV